MRKSISSFLFLILSAGLLLAFSTAAMADDDPPGRVARLNYMQGSVSFQPGGETDWVQANPNRPLTTGDNLWADRNSRGELHIDSTAIRLSSETGITFLNLDDRTVQIQLAQGSLSAHVRRLDGGDAFEIDTPNLAFTVQRPGEYRVDVDPDGNTTIVTVREGEGDVTGGGSEFHLDSGDSDTFSGTDSLTYDEGKPGHPDEFDQWCRSRDDREERAQSARYVSRDVIGYEDLDEYGDWRSVPDYGYVWFPSRVAAGWAPYRFGHWVWIEPWGWTWVEDEPWGFAPFHYGRWAVYGGGWCWVPGPIVVRPVYAPALVVFVGGAEVRHVALALAVEAESGGFRWGRARCTFRRTASSVRYVQNVNITNTTVNVVNVTNVYNNGNVSRITYMHRNNVGAVTAVSRDTFVNARPVGAGCRPRESAAASGRRGPTRRLGGPGTKERHWGGSRSDGQTSRSSHAAAGDCQGDAGCSARALRKKPAEYCPPNPERVPTRQQLDQLRGQQATTTCWEIYSAEPAEWKPAATGPRPDAATAGSSARAADTAATRTEDLLRRPSRVEISRSPAASRCSNSRVKHADTQRQQQPARKIHSADPAEWKSAAARPRPDAATAGSNAAAQQRQQQPALRSTPPTQPRENQPQPGRVPMQQQPNQTRGQQEQQPAVKYAPPARVNQDTYHPHQFEKPQNAAPAKTPKRAAESARTRTAARAGIRSKPDAGDQDRKQH